MRNQITNIEVVENRESFFLRLAGRLSPEEIADVQSAYDFAKYAHGHKNQMRSTGGRYFEHPRALCLMAMDELGLYERDMLICLLLHDVGEDTAFFGNVLESYDGFLKTARSRISKIFGAKCADIIIRLTKPSVDNIRFGSKDEVYQYYLTNLAQDEEASFYKMFDRLHNLRSLPSDKPNWVRNQIIETQTKLLPIFRDIKGKRKRSAEIMIDKIHFELDRLESVLN